MLVWFRRLCLFSCSAFNITYASHFHLCLGAEQIIGRGFITNYQRRICLQTFSPGHLLTFLLGRSFSTISFEGFTKSSSLHDLSLFQLRENFSVPRLFSSHSPVCPEHFFGFFLILQCTVLSIFSYKMYMYKLSNFKNVYRL